MALFDPIKLCGAFLYDDVEYIKQVAYNIKNAQTQELPIGKFLLDLYVENNLELFKLFAFSYNYVPGSLSIHRWRLRKMFKKILDSPDDEKESMICRICEQFTIDYVVYMLLDDYSHNVYFDVLAILNKKYDLSQHLNSCHAMYIIEFGSHWERILEYGFKPYHYGNCQCEAPTISSGDRKTMTHDEIDYMKKLNILIKMGLTFNDARVSFKNIRYVTMFRKEFINTVLHNGLDIYKNWHCFVRLIRKGYECVLKFIESHVEKDDKLLEFLLNVAKEIVEHRRTPNNLVTLQQIIDIDSRVRNMPFDEYILIGGVWDIDYDPNEDSLLDMLKLFNLSQTSLNSLLYLSTTKYKLNEVSSYLISKGADVMYDNNKIFKENCFHQLKQCKFIINACPKIRDHLDTIIRGYFAELLNKSVDDIICYFSIFRSYKALPLTSQYIGNIDVSKIISILLNEYKTRLEATPKLSDMTQEEYEGKSNFRYLSGNTISLIKTTYALNHPCKKTMFDIMPELYRKQFYDVWDKCHSEYGITKSIIKC